MDTLNSFIPMVAVVLAAALIVGVVWYVRKHGIPTSAAQVQANLTADAPTLLVDLKALVAKLESKMTEGTASVRAELAAIRAISSTLQPRYIDRDDFMKAIGATAYAYAVTLDGKLVHNGQAPTVAYTTQPDGSVAVVATP